MKTIIQIATACLILSGVLAADSSTAPVFQMRLVAERPSDSTESMVLLHQRNGQTNKETLYVEETVSADQTDLESVNVIPPSATSGARIQIQFTEQGKKKFAELTRKSLGKRLAIIIEGQLYSAPMIRGEITGGLGEISGTFTEEEAKELTAKITESLASH